jgi:D-amino-acid dehydrogenase
MKVAVVGSGIAGVTAAYFLAKEGCEVSVFEKERYPAMRTSYANGGQISVSNSEVWTTWKNVKKGIKWMFTKDAPLLIRPTLEWRKVKWMTSFLWHTLVQDYGRNTATTIRLGLESRDLLRQIAEDENLKFDQSNCGILHFYKDEAYFNDAVAVKDLYNANGCEWDVVDPTAIKKIEPTLDESPILGGTWTPSDWTGDIHKFCRELVRVMQEKYKVKFYYGHDISHIEEISYFDKIVIANGVDCYKLAKTVGDTLPVYPVKGYSITINLDEESAKHAPTTSLLDDQAKIVTARLGNRFRVAGTAELTGDNWDIRKDRIEPLLRWVNVNFPKIDTSNYVSWACLRPMTPNMMPIVSQSKNNSQVFYHVGHGHLGWTLAAATARNLSKMVINS